MITKIKGALLTITNIRGTLLIFAKKLYPKLDGSTNGNAKEIK